MGALRFFASGSAALLFALAGCSLVIDTDPADPQARLDAGRSDADAGASDLGNVDLGNDDLGRLDLGSGDLGVDDGGALDGALPPRDGGMPGAVCGLDSECDDGAHCTVDRCQLGTCTNLFIPGFCDDGASCTLDFCVPATMCAGPIAIRLGCEHRPDDAACAGYAVGLFDTYPGLACAPVTCIGVTAGNDTGCGFGDSRCAFGDTCNSSGLCAGGMAERTCDEASDCDDRNPCNGPEACGSPRKASVCAPATTSACQPTPSGPTFPGTCALAPSAGGVLSALCAPFADACTAAP